jgi:hypothetical protein
LSRGVVTLAHPMVNLARFDLVSIRLAVACGAVGQPHRRGGRASHLALAAASRRLRELEAAHRHASLFERHSRGLQVTAAGRLFVSMA